MTELSMREIPPCPRCGGPGLLLARFPHTWENARGKRVEGFREAVLCRECDARAPQEAELLALFALEEQITTANLDRFQELLEAWSETVRTPDPRQVANEAERWRRGEL